MIELYLTFGVGFYIGLALNNASSFRNATKIEITRGLVLAIFFWPVALALIPFIKDRLR